MVGAMLGIVHHSLGGEPQTEVCVDDMVVKAA
jgi:hypothetical protein